MAKYVFVYRGGGAPASEEEGQKLMAAWMGWIGGLGDSVIEVGNPFGSSKTVGSGSGSGLSGYSIIDAESLDDAATKADGCPVLQSPDGAVDVYEAIAM